LGDALGSVGVIVSGLIMKYWEDLGGDPDSDYRYLADPVSSLLIIIIIVAHTLPLVKECIHILLENVPENQNVGKIKTKIKSIQGVQGIHNLHLWQLDSQKQILTCHIECQNDTRFMSISDKIKTYLHKIGIHSSTLQPEFCNSRCNHDSQDENRCHDITCGNQKCLQDSCC
jgi:zinc transporter 1